MKGRHIGLALQGGGSYAAFTAGALRALLRKQRRLLATDEIHSISGTSGGAVNAVLLGLAIHNSERNPLAYVNKLWEMNQIEKLVKKRFAHLHLLPDELLALIIGEVLRLKEMSPGLASLHNEFAKLSDFAYDCMNKMLHHAVPDLADDPGAALLQNDGPFVTVAATEVRTAVAHYFTNNERMIRKFERFKIGRRYNLVKRLSLNGLFASVAHPSIFNSVKIGDNVYWDGYYSSNPPFMWLFREGCDEVILIRLVQQMRDVVSDDIRAVKDRIEEIIQNTTPNMEILIYLAMREIIANNQLGSVQLKMAPRRLTRQSVYHEIRLLKSGNISDEGYPLAGLVQKLMALGEKVVADRRGFAAAYRKADKGLQVVSEVDFETEEVATHLVDLDELLFEEEAPTGETAN